jgi:hypothetical protein
MEIILDGLSIFIICWMITRFKPLEMILDILPSKYLIFNLIKLLFSCLMCVSFWATLIWTGDIVFASTMGFGGFWYDKIIGFYETRVRLN